MLYQINNLNYHSLTLEKESYDYGACTFEIDELKIVFRVAKITSKKIGQFVTFWKRTKNGPIAPYDTQDNFDFLIVCARSEESFGQFIFPKYILLQKGVLSKNSKGGKRAIRVYPPWEKAQNQQAIKTQTWQIPHFIKISPIFEHHKIEQLLFNSQKKNH